MEYFAKSDIGNYRKQNEDFYWCGNGLFIVADGMGSHTAGEVASKLAVESFVKFFLPEINKFKTYKKNKKHKIKHKNEIKESNKDKSRQLNHAAAESAYNAESNFLSKYNLEHGLKPELKTQIENFENIKIDSETIKEILTSSIRYSNKEVYNLSIKKHQYSGMGTTFTGCFINSGVANIVHVGDSRVYINHQKKLKLVTSDHTVVGEMYRNGLITYEEMFRHPLRNYLNNVLGLSAEVAADFITCSITDDDILVLCTDGLNSMLKDNEIEAIINKFKEPQKITEKLILSANKKGGFDNTTIITVLI